MKKAKLIKKTEKEKIIENEYSLKAMIKTIIILLIVFGLFYLITYFVVNKENKVVSNETPAVIDNEKITVSNLFSQKEDEYYVIATKKSMYEKAATKYEPNYIEMYDNYISKYQQQDDSLKVYKVDLDSAFNKNYLSDKTNISNDLQELKIGNEVLIKISNKKIKEYYVGHSDIIDALKSL